MTEKKQIPLFENKEWWSDEWEGMPEFDQEDLTSDRRIIVHFRNKEDMDAFAELINQRIAPRQVSLWFPEMKFRYRTDKEYIDEP